MSIPPTNKPDNRAGNHDKDAAPPAWWGWWGPLWPLGEALRFLTILPLPGLPPTSAQTIARAIPWFPLAGLLIGLLLLPVGWLAGQGWNATVQAACLVVAWGILSAGLHLDGLSDTFDGVLSWRSRDEKLAIMKDSRVGAMGAIALVVVLLLKFAWLHSAGERWWVAVLLAPLWGRWASMYALHWFPAARAGGLGQAFRAQTQRPAFVLSTVAALLLALLIGQGSGLVAGLLVALSTTLLARWWTRDLGGLTGDTYGALTELAEVVALAALTFGWP
jgi:adenosylcobinamide-GDP ribazoletransferase